MCGIHPFSAVVVDEDRLQHRQSLQSTLASSIPEVFPNPFKTNSAIDLHSPCLTKMRRATERMTRPTLRIPTPVVTTGPSATQPAPHPYNEGKRGRSTSLAYPGIKRRIKDISNRRRRFAQASPQSRHAVASWGCNVESSAEQWPKPSTAQRRMHLRTAGEHYPERLPVLCPAAGGRRCWVPISKDENI